jgi:hypothetical protein
MTTIRAAVAAVFLAASFAAGAAETFDTTAGNLLVVLRETPGANKQDDALRAIGKVRATLKDGREVEFEASWFDWLGDLHVRLVFDGGQKLQTASPEDLQRLRLSPEEAIARAVQNLRQRYGAPTAVDWGGGLMAVRGGAPDLVSSYVLDRDFWLEQSRLHPQGVLVSAPQRTGLVFAPVGDDAALFNLQFSAAALFARDDRTRLSSAIYLFKDGRWSVYQPAQGALSDPPSAALPR